MIDKIVEKTIEGLRHPIIYTALVAAVCKLTQAWIYKHVLHLEINGLVASLPWVLAGIYASISIVTDLPEEKKKLEPRVVKALNPIYWNLTIIITTTLSVAIPYFRQ